MLSEHFAQSEFENDAPVPADCVAALTALCQDILEPIRAYVKRPITITSGYRTPEANAAAHGVSDSEHIYSPDKCAADFTFATTFGMLMSMRVCFDWIRNNLTLPFHQVILEHNATGQSIIHISYNRTTLPVRQALEGATHNASPYTHWECAQYSLPTSDQENA